MLMPIWCWPAAPSWQRQAVKYGKLGQKTGARLYRWEKDEPRSDGGITPDVAGAMISPDDDELCDRLVLPSLNACMQALRCEVIIDADTLDAAMVFGAGFAPFRGGLMHYARARGAAAIRARLTKFAEQFGPRFTPDPDW